jgi:hypothetical protein
MSQTHRILGIDPGLKGAMALLDGSGKIIEVATMPVMKEAAILDLYAMKRCIERLRPTYAFIERVHAIRGAAASSTFKFGEGIGNIHATLVGLSVPYIAVPPKRWQAVCHAGVEAKFDAKHRSAVAAMRLFPDFDFRLSDRRKNYHDGAVDAVLIAFYGYRWLTDESVRVFKKSDQ